MIKLTLEEAKKMTIAGKNSRVGNAMVNAMMNGNEHIRIESQYLTDEMIANLVKQGYTISRIGETGYYMEIKWS